VPFTFGTEASNEGDFVQVTCNVKRGDEPLTVSWSLKGDVISSEPSITTSMIGTRTSILMITSVGYRHSGQYTCTAKNAAGVDHFTTELKVNGKGILRLSPAKREIKGSGSLFTGHFFH
jgi:hypothetical protein